MIMNALMVTSPTLNWFMSHGRGGAIFSDSGLAGGPVVEIMG